jgi:hypothetical protein
MRISPNPGFAQSEVMAVSCAFGGSGAAVGFSIKFWMVRVRSAAIVKILISYLVVNLKIRIVLQVLKIFWEYSLMTQKQIGNATFPS